MISNIRIKNFRNIREANVDFSNINILTGKNSCGKSNLLDLIKTFPSTWDENVYDKFDGNIVSEGAGISESTIEFKFIFKGPRITSTISSEPFLTPARKTFFGSIYKEFCIEKKILKNGFLKSFDVNLMAKSMQENLTTEDVYDLNSNDDEIQNIFSKYLKRLEKKNIEKYLIPINISYKNNIEKKISELLIFNQKNIRKTLPKQCFPILSNSVKEFENLQKFFIDSFSIKNIEETVERIKKQKKNISHFRGFNDSNLYYLLADVQSNKKIFKEYIKNINLYTNNIITSFSINVSGKGTRQGHFNVESPNGSNSFSSLSMGTLIMLYVITLNSWLSLKVEQQTFQVPTYFIFDEIDSYLHPDLISSFSEILKCISEKSQIFFASHSPLFIDQFEKKDIYILQDSEKNKSNIMNYEDVMLQLPKEIQEEFKNSKPSELFSEGYINDFIPLK